VSAPGGSGSGGARPRALLALVAAAIAFAVYLPVRDGAFVFDDDKLVLGNEELWRRTESLGGELAHVAERMLGIFRPEEESAVRTAFRPVRFASLRIDALLTRAFGLEGETSPHRAAPAPRGAAAGSALDPAPGAAPGSGRDRPAAISSATRSPSPLVFHLHNALLHALNTLLVALLVARVRPTAPLALPALFALAFALHPVQTESVAYISGRRDVLFAFFYLLALVVYAGGRRDGGWGRGLALAGLAWLSLGAKEMAATLPAAMLLLEAFAPAEPGDRPGWRRIADRLPLWLPSGLAVLVFAGFLLARQNPGEGVGWWGGSPANAFFGSMRALLEYARLLVWPHPLTVDYSYDAFPASRGPFSPWSGAASLIVVVAAISVAVRERRRRPELAASIALFLVLIAPVAQLVPHPERFAEHHLYLPSIAFLAGVCSLLGERLARAREGATAGALVVLLVWGGLTSGRLDAWQGPYPLWRSAAEAYPRCARAHFGRGSAAWELGRPAEAVAALATAIEILAPIEREPLQQGYYLQALQIRASILAGSGVESDLLAARGHLETLLRETDTDGEPVAEDPVVWSELARVRERLGEREGAIAAAERVLSLGAPSAIALEAELFLAAARAAAGEREQAEAALLAAEERAGSDRERALLRYQLGLLRQEAGRHAEAVEDFARAEAAIGETGRRSTARYKRAESLLHLGRAGAARAALEELLADEPGHLPALLSLAELALGAGELDEAERLFLAVYSAAPEEPRAREGLLQARARRKIATPAPAEAPDPTKVTALALLADRLEAEGRLEDALEALAKAEKQCEGPEERERRAALRLRIARLTVRTGYLASREGDETLARARLELAARAYADHRAVAEPVERGAAAIEAAELARVTAGPAAGYALLHAEWEAGVREPRLVAFLAALAELAGESEAALGWHRAVLDDATSSEEARSAAEAALRRRGEERE